MTVKELVEELSKYPDHMEVKIMASYSQMYEIPIGTVVSSDEWIEDEPVAVWLCEGDPTNDA